MVSSSPMELGIDCRERSARPTWGLDSAAVVTLAVLGCSVALVLAWRRLQGAMDRPVPLKSLLAVGGALLIAGLIVRAHAICVSRRASVERHVRFWVLWFSPAAMTLGMGIAMTSPTTAPRLAAGLWVAVVLYELGAVIVLRRAVAFPPANGVAIVVQGHDAETSIDDCEESEGTEDTFEFPRGVTQQMTRFATDEGQDVVTAVMRAGFELGKRQQNLHVAFCPPFVTIPEVSARQVAGPPTTLKVAQVLHHGLRVEVRLVGDCPESADVLVEVTAVGDLQAGQWQQGHRMADEW